MQFLCFFGALLLSKRLFSCQMFLTKKLDYYSRYGFNSFKKMFSKGLSPNRAKRMVRMQFFHTLPCYCKTCKNFWRKVKIVFHRPKCVLSEIAINPMWSWCIKVKKQIKICLKLNPKKPANIIFNNWYGETYHANKWKIFFTYFHLIYYE